MKLTKSQFKRWMTQKTRQYVALITDLDPDYVKISFPHNFNQYRGYLREAEGICCQYDSQIWFRTDYLEWWNVNKKALENLIIHEVCHLVHIDHGNDFFTLYKLWSGDDYITRYHNSEADYVRYGRRYACSVRNLPHHDLMRGKYKGKRL